MAAPILLDPDARLNQLFGELEEAEGDLEQARLRHFAAYQRVRAELEQQGPLRTAQLLTLKEVGQRLALGQAKLWSMIRQGELQVIRIGGAVRVAESELERLVRVNQQ